MTFQSRYRNTKIAICYTYVRYVLMTMLSRVIISMVYKVVGTEIFKQAKVLKETSKRHHTVIFAKSFFKFLKRWQRNWKAFRQFQSFNRKGLTM